MTALTIRHVEEPIKTALRIRAAQHGISMEEQARRILREALSDSPPPSPPPTPFGQRLLKRFAGVASTDFALPERHPPRTPPSWD